MKRKGRSVHVTITIPRSLRKKMEETSGINWSRVARKAFQLEIEKRIKNETSNRKMET